MTYRDLDRWEDLFRMNPEAMPPDAVRSQCAEAIRQLCVNLNNWRDRGSIQVGLATLERMGRLLAVHRWLAGDG